MKHNRKLLAVILIAGGIDGILANVKYFSKEKE